MSSQYGSIFSFSNNQPQTAEPEENYGMPSSWHPVDTPPIDPNQSPFLTNSTSTFSSGPLPPNFGLQPDLVNTGYKGLTAPIRLMPIAGGPQENAKTETIIKNTVQNNVINSKGNVIALETNGAPNPDQTYLNLVSGQNTSFSSTGGGSVQVNTPVFGPSGSGHSSGAVPDPGAAAGTTKYIREDGTWQVPPGTGGAAYYQTVQKAGVSEPSEFRLNFLNGNVVDNPGNTSSDVTIPANALFSLKNLVSPVSILASTLTQIDSISVTMPSSGGPWRVLLRYQYFMNGGVGYIASIFDAFNYFATSQGLVSNNNSCLSGSELTYATYANGATVTFRSYVFGDGNSTIVLSASAEGSPSRVTNMGVSHMSASVLSTN